MINHSTLQIFIVVTKSSVDIEVFLQPLERCSIADFLGRCDVAFKTTSFKDLIDMSLWSTVDVVEPALAGHGPAENDTIAGSSGEVVENYRLELDRNMFDDFDRNCPVVNRKPVLRQCKVDESYLYVSTNMPTFIIGQRFTCAFYRYACQMKSNLGMWVCMFEYKDG